MSTPFSEVLIDVLFNISYELRNVKLVNRVSVVSTERVILVEGEAIVYI